MFTFYLTVNKKVKFQDEYINRTKCKTWVFAFKEIQTCLLFHYIVGCPSTVRAYLIKSDIFKCLFEIVFTTISWAFHNIMTFWNSFFFYYILPTWYIFCTGLHFKLLLKNLNFAIFPQNSWVNWYPCQEPLKQY